jgi:hypothetical protein
MPIPSMSMLQASGGPAAAVAGPVWENNFNAANGSFSDPDVTVAGGAWVIASNRLTNTTDYAGGTVLVDGPSYANDDQWVRFTWAVADGYINHICVNATAPSPAGTPATGSGYSMRFDTSNPGQLFRDGTSLGYISIGTPAPGDTIELRRVDAGGGSVQLRCYVNGTLASGSITDSSPLSGGYPGWALTFRDSGQGMTTFDDASAGDSTWNWS